MKGLKIYVGRFLEFLKGDSWPSLVAILSIALIFIKFLFFPGLSFLTGTDLPLVIVESCSMYHQENGFENIFKNKIYKDYGVGIEDSKNWDFQNGLNKGDVIFVIGARDIEVGDVIIFNGGTTTPIIHRVVSSEKTYSTKGDNNFEQLNFEKRIVEEQLVGKALFKIPFIGWIKLIFFEMGRDSEGRGFCV